MNQHTPGSKIAEKLFSRPEGATMAEVVAALGSRPRNLLERLQASGYTIRSQKEGRTTRYWAKRSQGGIDDLVGILHRPGMRPRTLEEIEEGVIQGAVERAMRGLKPKK